MSTFSSVLRRALIAIAACLSIGALAPAAGLAAGTDHYYGQPSAPLLYPFCYSYDCVIRTSDPYNPHLVNDSRGVTENGNTICAYSFDSYGGGSYGNASATVCSSSTAIKSLCGCVSRIGASRATVDGPRPRGWGRITW